MIEQVIAPASTPTTFLLGAGFSKAVSAQMPLTDELGLRIAERLQLAGERSTPSFAADGVTFENWMTWLAERQPFHSEEEHLEDRARFARVTGAIADELRDAQQAATAGGLPSWLSQFVDLAHWSRSSLITLNYDTLIEAEISEHPRHDSESVVRPHDVVVGTPNAVGVFTGKATGYRNRETLRLHKLHGSTDWYAVPGDATGATLEQISQPDDGTYAAKATIGGREPFIVPPTSTKGGYFDNPKTRFIWRQARDALNSSERIVLMGYSLPLTDTALARLFHSTIGQGSQRLLVVDPDADAVVQRLRALGVANERVEMLSGRQCVADFVAHEVNVAARELATAVAGDPALGRPVSVGWESSGWGAITNARLSGLTLELVVDRVDRPLAGLRHPESIATEDSGARSTMTLGDLVHLGQFERVELAIDGARLPVVARVTTGAPNSDDWLLLRPAGAPPSG